MSTRYPGFGQRRGDDDSSENFVTIGTHFDPAEPTNSTSILATLGRKQSKLVDLSSSTYGYDGKRFHGAFTGGFNAGFYNTVGSVEGWRPSEFKSSRSARADKRSYEPEDFMDKGDFGEHGINPKQIKIRSTFDQNDSGTRSTKTQSSNDDVLREMIRVKPLSIGKKILISMGWKPGEGIGAKMARRYRQKLKLSLTQETSNAAGPSSAPPTSESAESTAPTGVKVYGVAMPPPSYQQHLMKVSRLDDDDDDEFDEHLYANVSLPPLDYEVHFQLQKQEHHGIGYKPLESTNLFGHDNLFVQPSISKQIKNVKIRGQAFGVGIEEDEDDRDLFAEDDLKQYDYELTGPSETSSTDVMRQKTLENNFVLKFVRYEAMSMPIVYPPPEIPNDFRPGHRFPKSEMPPPPPPSSATDKETNKPSSIQLDANSRAIILGDFSFLSRPPPNMAAVPPAVPPSPAEVAPAPAPTPVKKDEAEPALEWDVEKERATHVQPAPTTNTPRNQFLDAVKNRFTSSSDREQLTERQSLDAALENDLKKAVSLKMYGTLTRSNREWRPNPLLCKRMNIPNPYSDESYEETKESKKSRRQMCSNLFEHLFTQSSIGTDTSALSTMPPPEVPSSSAPPAPADSPSTSSTSTTIPKSTPPPNTTAPKSEFAPINSFEQEQQERPPMDFFSAIFDNQDSDDENDEQQTDATKAPSTATAPPTVMKPAGPIIPNPQLKLNLKRDTDESDSSDSSIEEIAPPSKPLLYGPDIPSTLPSRPRRNHEAAVWEKLTKPEDDYVEIDLTKHKKKHHKKKKHKKSKKHHH